MNESLKERRIRISSLNQNDNLKPPNRVLATLAVHNSSIAFNNIQRDKTPARNITNIKDPVKHFMQEYEITGITPRIEKSFFDKAKLVT